MSIVVAGYTGLVGSAIFELFKSRGANVVGLNSKTLDLLDRNRTFEFIIDMKPDVVIDAAAIVGGIDANHKYPVEFLSQNLQIQSNLMDAAHFARVKRFVFLGSACIYPKQCAQPIKEEYLLTGPLEPTNSAYAIAKIAGLKLVESYRRQYGHRWISLMPTNMYGPRDNFGLDRGHVFGALINRFVTAVETGAREVVLWGTGTPRREFLHSRDLAEATAILLEKYDDDVHINVGTGEDVEIKELAALIASETGFNGAILWDTSKHDGTPRRLLDVSKVKSFGWYPRVTLREGIREAVAWYKANREGARK